MDTIELLKKLISIPSYVGNGADETEIGGFIYGYLKQLPWLDVVKQPVVGNRFNVIAKDNYPTKLLICGHIDTVQPGKGWIKNPFVSRVNKEKIIGLGSSDMKGGIAAMLDSLSKLNGAKGLMALFYIDEEYDFLGTKAFIKKYQKIFKPQMILSCDGGELKIGNSCRGIIEIRFQLIGRGGHSANPRISPNPIIEGAKLAEKLKMTLRKFDNQYGLTTLNLPYLAGGNLTQGNVIPSEAELTFEVRSASPDLNAKKVISLIKTMASSRLSIRILSVRNDFQPWITKKEELSKLGKICHFRPANKLGAYYDIALLVDTFKCPAATIGAGLKNQAHKAGEYVSIRDVINFEKIFFFDKI